MIDALRKLICLTLGLFLVILGAKAQAPLPHSDTLVYSIDTFYHEIFLVDDAFILFDPNDEYQFSDLQNKTLVNNWQPLAKFERTSFPGRNRPWIKISLQNQLLEQQQWVFDCSFINDSIIAYAVWENAILQYHFFLFSSYKNVSALIAHFGCFR